MGFESLENSSFVCLELDAEPNQNQIQGGEGVQLRKSVGDQKSSYQTRGGVQRPGDDQQQILAKLRLILQ